MELKEDWQAVASKALSLLKPGGAIQWIEGCFGDDLMPLCAVPGSRPDLAALIWNTWLRLSGYFKAAGTVNRLTREGLKGLEATLTTCDQLCASWDVTSANNLPENRAAWTLNMLEVLKSVCLGAVKGMDSLGFAAGRLEQRFADMMDMAREGKVYLEWEIYVYTAFKRLGERVTWRLEIGRDYEL